MDCYGKTITIFLRNQECIKKYKITVSCVKTPLFQIEINDLKIRNTKSDSKNGSIRHIT